MYRVFKAITLARWPKKVARPLVALLAWLKKTPQRATVAYGGNVHQSFPCAISLAPKK